GRVRDCAGLAHRGVAAGDRGDQRCEGEVHRVVPRRDDQRGAQGLAAQLAGGGGQQRAQREPLGPQPGAQVLHRVRDLLRDHADLGQGALRARLAEILGERTRERRFLAAQAAAQRLELGEASVDGPGGAGIEGVAQGGDVGEDAGSRRAVPAHRAGGAADLLRVCRHGDSVGPGPGSRERPVAARCARRPGARSGGRCPSRPSITENGSSEGPTSGPRRKGRAMAVLMTAPLLLTMTLLLSGLAKLGARQGTEEAMTSLRLPLRPLHRTVASVLPVAEIVLALMLWIPSVPLQTAVAVVIALLMLTYLVIIARALT